MAASKNFPLVRILLVLIGGILAGYFNPISTLPLSILKLKSLSILIVVICLLFFSKYRKTISVSIYLTIGVISYLHFCNTLPQNIANHFSNYSSTKYLLAKVKSKKEKEESQTLVLAVNCCVDSCENAMPCKGRLSAFIKGSENYRIGQTLIIPGDYSEIKSNTNPKAFDFKKYYATQRIYHQSFVASEEIQVLHEPSNKLMSSINCAREYILNLFGKYLKNENQNAIAQAMVLGKKDQLEDSTKKLFANTGSMHILAVSGLHVGIIAMIAMTVLYPLKLNFAGIRWIKAIACVGIVAAYTLITGSPPSAIRALLMFTLFVIAKNLNKRPSAYNILAGAAIIMLINNPTHLFEAGFQFSFLALLSIIFFFPITFRRLKTGNEVWNKVLSLICLSVSAQVLILPLSLYYFNQNSTVFWLSGIVAVPAAFVIVTACLSLGAFELISLTEINESIISPLISSVIDIFIGFTKILDAIPYTVVTNLQLDFKTLLLTYLCLSLLMLLIWRKRIIYLLIMLMMMSSFPCISIYSKSLVADAELVIYNIPGKLLMDFIDSENYYVYKDKDLSDEKEEFAAYKNRLSKGKKKSIFLSPKDHFNDLHLEYRNGIIQFQNELILISSGLKNKFDYSKAQIKFFIIDDQCSICHEELNVNLYLLSSNLNWRDRIRIKKLLEHKNVHDIKTDGAFEYKFI